MHQTAARLQEATGEAVECLRAMTRDGKSESARVSAARTILEQAFDVVDLEDIQQRLTALEKAMITTEKPK